MARKLDLSTFNFSEEQIRAVNEIIFDQLAEAPELSALHSFWTGIEYKKEVGFITDHGMVGKKRQGCNPTPHDWNINTRKVTWDPQGWEVYLDECADDLEDTAAVYARNHGVRINDLTDTDYMAIVVEVLGKAIKEALIRIVWFGDVNATNYVSGGSGIITSGISTDYFDILDGFFKQLQIAVTGGAKTVTIAANSQASKAAQLAGMTPQVAYDILTEAYFALDPLVRAAGKVRFLVTQTIADAYQQYLVGKNLESTYKNLTDGVKALTIHGVDVVPVPLWDKMIQSYNDLGTTFYKPHRFVLAEQENLAVGIPSEEVLTEVDVWYEKKERKNYMLASDAIDAKLLNDTRIVYGQ